MGDGARASRVPALERAGSWHFEHGRTQIWVGGHVMTVEQKTYLRLLLMFVGMCTFVIMFEGWRGPLDQLLLVSSFGITIAYLASMTYLMDYLRRSHTWMWTN